MDTFRERIVADWPYGTGGFRVEYQRKTGAWWQTVNALWLEGSVEAQRAMLDWLRLTGLYLND